MEPAELIHPLAADFLAADLEDLPVIGVGIELDLGRVGLDERSRLGVTIGSGGDQVDVLPVGAHCLHQD